MNYKIGDEVLCKGMMSVTFKKPIKVKITFIDNSDNTFAGTTVKDYSIITEENTWTPKSSDSYYYSFGNIVQRSILDVMKKCLKNMK